MTKGINRRSFHHIPGKPDTPRTPFAVCSTTILLRRADTFFIFTRRSLPPSSSIFTVPFAILPCCFFGFFAVRQIRGRLRCFSRSRILFLSRFDKPSQTTRRDQSIAASSDKRVRPYRCRFAAFSRSIIPPVCREV